MYSLIVLWVVLTFLNLPHTFGGVITGSLSWNKNGQSVSSYIAQTGGANGAVSPSGSSVTFSHGPRFYFASTNSDSFTSSMFERLYLLDSTFSFSVDLSGIGCGCNVALYTVSMPGGGPSSCGDYYCDANNVCGQRCTEMDIMEANNNAFQVTPHQSTDGGGCARKVHTGNNYGWGSQYTINTQSAFDVSMSFFSSGGSLDHIVTTLKQNGHTVSVTHDSACGGGYLAGMTQSMKDGMVLVFSHWGNSGEMGWLDSPPCSSSATCNHGTARISNIALSGSSGGGGGSPPPSSPPPSSSDCWDKPIPGSDTTCAQQAGWGKCGEWYIQGYCDLSCKRCTPCTDKPIPGSDTTCAQQAGWGKCGESYIQGYCDISCGRCCGDVPPPGDTYGCAQQTAWGNCGQWWMKGYCKKSCGACTSHATEDASAVSATGSNNNVAVGVGVAVAVVVLVVLVVVVVVVVRKRSKMETV